MALVATTLGFRYGTRAVLDAVSLRIEAGQVLGILGPNGAGKSTLARLLLGLEAPHAGRVTIDDAPLETLPIRDRARRIAAVLQNEATPFAFSVRELVMFARDLRRPAFSAPTPADHAAVDEALRAADAYALADRPANALSGGERQRVLLARALAQDTPYLVLDEPTAFLDIKHRHMLAHMFRTLGRAIVWILHDPDLALRYCTDVLVLHGGRVAATELSPEVLSRVFAVKAERVTDSAGGAHLLVTGSNEPRLNG